MPVQGENGRRNSAREGLFFCKGCCEYALEEFGEGTSVVVVLGHPQVDQLIVHAAGLETGSLTVAMLLTAAMDLDADLSRKEQ